MELTKEQLQDKIFVLEMELEALKAHKFAALASCGFSDDLNEVYNNFEIEIQETICYIRYYNDQLQYLEGQQ